VAWVKVNGYDCWSQAFQYNEGSQMCGEGHNWHETRVPVSCPGMWVGKGETSLTVEVGTTLNQVRPVVMRVRAPSPREQHCSNSCCSPVVPGTQR
jgi:hypothetical protein